MSGEVDLRTDVLRLIMTSLVVMVLAIGIIAGVHGHFERLVVSPAYANVSLIPALIVGGLFVAGGLYLAKSIFQASSKAALVLTVLLCGLGGFLAVTRGVPVLASYQSDAPATLTFVVKDPHAKPFGCRAAIVADHPSFPNATLCGEDVPLLGVVGPGDPIEVQGHLSEWGFRHHGARRI